MIDKAKTLENNITYYYDKKLICKKNLRYQNHKMHPNYKYKIIKMDNQTFTLKDTLYNIEFQVPHQSIVANFTLPYCNTVHATQGSRIKYRYVICDYKNGMLSREWFYTAITRCVRLSDIYFLNVNTKEMNIRNVTIEAIARYKYQDRKAKREIDVENYIDVDWVLENYYKMKGRCNGKDCGNFMSFEKSNIHKVSVNRLNNDIGHTKANCEIMCKICNCRLSNK